MEARGGNDMDNTVRACDLNDEAEAALICKLLDGDGIPYILRRTDDSPYDGIFRSQVGWGFLEASSAHIDKIHEVVTSVRNQRKLTP